MWGGNRYGQFWIKTYEEGGCDEKTLPYLVLKDVKFATLGDETSAIIKKDGSFWTTGRNDNGQLGDGTTKIGKGLKQGNYVVKIKVAAKGNENYKAITKTIDVPVVIE